MTGKECCRKYLPAELYPREEAPRCGWAVDVAGIAVRALVEILLPGIQEVLDAGIELEIDVAVKLEVIGNLEIQVEKARSLFCPVLLNVA